jgi:HlyD family secretion protein
MRKTILTVTVLLIASATVGYLNLSGGERGSSYRFVSLERGDLEAVVSSTGKLDAVMTVQVGTQVSGIISKIFVDFNDRVTAGQVIALLDTTLLGIAVRDAETNVERNDAQLRQAERDFERARELYDKKIVAAKSFVCDRICSNFWHGHRAQRGCWADGRGELLRPATLPHRQRSLEHADPGLGGRE